MNRAGTCLAAALLALLAGGARAEFCVGSAHQQQLNSRAQEDLKSIKDGAVHDKLAALQKDMASLAAKAWGNGPACAKLAPQSADLMKNYDKIKSDYAALQGKQAEAQAASQAKQAAAQAASALNSCKSAIQADLQKDSKLALGGFKDQKTAGLNANELNKIATIDAAKPDLTLDQCKKLLNEADHHAAYLTANFSQDLLNQSLAAQTKQAEARAKEGATLATERAAHEGASLDSCKSAIQADLQKDSKLALAGFKDQKTAGAQATNLYKIATIEAAKPNLTLDHCKNLLKAADHYVAYLTANFSQELMDQVRAIQSCKEEALGVVNKSVQAITPRPTAVNGRITHPPLTPAQEALAKLRTDLMSKDLTLAECKAIETRAPQIH